MVLGGRPDSVGRLGDRRWHPTGDLPQPLTQAVIAEEGGLVRMQPETCRSCSARECPTVPLLLSQLSRKETPNTSTRAA